MSGAAVAILGATSHIAKGLIVRLLQQGCRQLHLYARSTDRVEQFLDEIKADRSAIRVTQDHNALLAEQYDLVINCVGVGTQQKLQGEYQRYFTLQEEFDALLLRFLTERCPRALGVKFSSGVVYGRDLTEPARADSCNCIPVNHVLPHDYYALTQLYVEAKHRSFKQLRLVDLRIFSYFSRYIDLGDGYFMTDLLGCLLKGETLYTDPGNMVRDYLHPEDLFAMILACLQIKKINAAYDVSSRQPVDKQRLLDFFVSHYGLKYQLRGEADGSSATGAKNIYCSNFQKAAELGYTPGYTSYETVIEESRFLIDSYNNGLTR